MQIPQNWHFHHLLLLWSMTKVMLIHVTTALSNISFTVSSSEFLVLRRPIIRLIPSSVSSNHKASTSQQTGGPSSSGPRSPLSEGASRVEAQHQSCPLPPPETGQLVKSLYSGAQLSW